MMRTSRALLRAATLVAAVVVTIAGPLATPSHAVEDPNRRDEYGLKPEDGNDKDLSLPDRVLDRNWPAPGPGEDTEPPHVAPDEDEIDPFKDEVAPPPPPPVKDESPPVEDKPKLPRRPLVGPDGKRDQGSPAYAPDPIAPDILEPEIDEPSEIDEEDRAPSPLDRGDSDYKNETDDPGEW